ncbi:MAG: hypothetical protein AABY88_09715 [Pseudomonadota bacterium]
MTQLLIAVDIGLSALFHERGVALAANFAGSIKGECADGSRCRSKKSAGTTWQLTLNSHDKWLKSSAYIG